MNSDHSTNTAQNGNAFWTKPLVVFLAALFCCFLWGSASPSIKIGYELFQVGSDDTPARILFAGIRFTIAGLMVILYESIRQHHLIVPGKSSWKYVFALASTQTVIQYIFFYWALALISGVHGSIINAAGTFFSILLSVAVFRFERLTAGKVVGSIAGFLGVLVIVTQGADLSAGVNVKGEIFMILAALSTALAGCLIKLFSAHENPVTLSGWQFFIGGIVMTILGLALGGRLHPTGPSAIILLVYMGFISAGAYTVWGILLKYNDVSRITILGFMDPVFGVLLSALFLHEAGDAFRWTTLIALVLVSFGIIVSQKGSPKAAKKA